MRGRKEVQNTGTKRGQPARNPAPPPGRSPRATTIYGFYNAAEGSRDPGDWPSLLRRSWEGRYGQTQPYPFGPDNMQSRGSRASQYTS